MHAQKQHASFFLLTFPFVYEFHILRRRWPCWLGTPDAFTAPSSLSASAVLYSVSIGSKFE